MNSAKFKAQMQVLREEINSKQHQGKFEGININAKLHHGKDAHFIRKLHHGKFEGIIINAKLHKGKDVEY